MRFGEIAVGTVQLAVDVTTADEENVPGAACPVQRGAEMLDSEVIAMLDARDACFDYSSRNPILAPERKAASVAQIFADLKGPRPIDGQVFRTAEEAAHWLGVPASALIA